jgi:hypothetical protein
MKESLFDIFQKHRDCYDYRKDPTIEEQQANPEARQLMAERFRERKQTASEYASSLIPLGNDWIEAVKYEVDYLTKSGNLPRSLYFNKAEREAYRDAVEDFLREVAAALREHGKGKFLNHEYFDPVTLYRFGIGTGWEEPQTGLSQDEAKQMATEMKQRYSQVYCFPDLFSMFPATYTVLGYKAKASTPAQAQNKADGSTKGTGMGNSTTANPETPPAAQETVNEWLSGKPKEVLDEAVNCGLAEKKEDGYYWIVGNQEKGWQTGLYGYFVLMVCEQLGWRTGKAKRLDWKKFKAVIKNHDEIVGTAKQTVDDYKKGVRVPTLYYKVDELVNKIFGIELSPTHKPL